MPGMSRWFITEMGLGIILCTVTIVPARTPMILVGGNDGMLHKGVAPQRGGLVDREEPQTPPPQRRGGREEPSEDMDIIDDQDPMAPAEPRLNREDGRSSASHSTAGVVGRVRSFFIQGGEFSP